MATTEPVWRDDRVRAHTAPYVNDRIDRLTRATIERYRSAPRSSIIRRLVELDREWDIDRALMANFAILGGVTSELGKRHEAWRWVFRSQMAFLLMHATIGWCPPMVVLRRMNFRTKKEIQGEREALLAVLRDRGEPLDEPRLASLPPEEMRAEG